MIAPGVGRYLSVLAGATATLTCCVLLTGWGSLGICWGLPAESLLTLDWLVPVLSIFVGSGLAGRLASRHFSGRGWWAGFASAKLCVLFWLSVWLFLTGRQSAAAWWRDGILQLTPAFPAWWLLALGVGTVGGHFASYRGPRRSKKLVPALVLFNSLLLITAAQSWTSPLESSGDSADAARWAVSDHAPDGTTVRLGKFDLKEIDFGLYDADQDDSRPRDDANATWLGQALPLVLGKVRAKSSSDVLCLVNGGFFGASPPYIGHHEAPLLQDGLARYDSTVLRRGWPAQACTLAWKRNGAGWSLKLDATTPFQELSRRYDGALGGVRALRIGGKCMNLQPGMGGTTMLCSRTSVGWDDQYFYVLSVRDPDGEAASLRAKQASAPQVGGWDVLRVERFWERSGVPNAVLFDGGESSQLAYLTERGDYDLIHSSYHFTRTLGYVRGRPVRFVATMLPPFLANGGVLNYFYVAKRHY